MNSEKSSRRKSITPSTPRRGRRNSNKKLRRKSLSLSPQARTSFRNVDMRVYDKSLSASRNTHTHTHTHTYRPELIKRPTSHGGDTQQLPFETILRTKTRDRMFHKVSVITNSRRMCIVDTDDLLSDCVNKMSISNSFIALVTSSKAHNETLKMVTREQVVNKVFCDPLHGSEMRGMFCSLFLSLYTHPHITNNSLASCDTSRSNRII
jgi:hypothetical protein